MLLSFLWPEKVSTLMSVEGDKISRSLLPLSQLVNKMNLLFFRKSKILLENVKNRSLSAVRSSRKSCHVNVTVLLFF